MTTHDTKNWFEIDRKGLAKLIERRGKVALVLELISNAFDADDVTRVDVVLTPEDGVPKAWLTVIDDAPNGFADITHAYTVFAESNRKADANKRGRFNLGEKLVLALCDEASIITTTAGVLFAPGGRSRMKARRNAGSEFMGLARITRDELREIIADLYKVIPPDGVKLTVNRIEIKHREPIARLTATLPTEYADAEGVLKRSERKCEVCIYEPFEGETPMLYELGIPVVETGDKFHVSIGQKVPLNMDRDNVTPSYLRRIRTLVVNELHEQLTEDDASTILVGEALADKDAKPEAVKRVLDLRFGEKRATWDPSDLEANMNLTAQGYTLIKPAQLNKAQWENVKKYEASTPAGQIAPTKKAEFSPDGEDHWVPCDKWTSAIREVVGYTMHICKALIDEHVDINVLSNIASPWSACFGRGNLGNALFVFNLGRLGHQFFEACIQGDSMRPTVDLNRLIIHELGHFFESNHLDDGYHEALCRLGARLTQLALDKPELFRRRYEPGFREERPETADEARVRRTREARDNASRKLKYPHLNED